MRFFIKRPGLDAFLEANNLGAYVIKPLRYIPDMCVMDFPEDFDLDALIADGCALEPDSVLTVDAVEPTLSVGKGYPVRPPLWHLDAVCSRGRGSRSSSISRTRTGAGVDIYVVDTTSNLSHPEFSSTSGRYIDVNEGITSTHADWLAPSFGMTNTTGLQAHGCWTAMVAGGDTLGMAPGATIVSVPVGSPGVAGIAMSDIADGLNAVLARVGRQSPYRHAVVNYSIGVQQSSFNTVSLKYQTFAMKTAYIAVQDVGNIPIVKSAGNSASGAAGNVFAAFNPPYRRTISNFAEGNGDYSGITTPIFSVGSCEIEDNVSQWCTYGDVLLTAPGTGIHLPNTEITLDSEAKVWTVGVGTSFSAPIVAGLLALYLEGVPVTDTIDLGVLRDWLVDNSTKSILTGIGTYESTYDPFLHFAGTPVILDLMDSTVWVAIQIQRWRSGVMASWNTYYLPAYAAYGTTTAGMTLTISRYTASSAPADIDQYWGFANNVGWFPLYNDRSINAGVTAVNEAAEYAAHPTPNRMAYNPYVEYTDTLAVSQFFDFDANTPKLRIECSKVSWSGYAINQQNASVLSGTLPTGVTLSCDQKSCYFECDTVSVPETTSPVVVVVRVVENQNAENNTLDVTCTITLSHGNGFGIEIFEADSTPANLINGYGLQLLSRVPLTGTGSHSYSFPLNDRNVSNGELRVIAEPADNQLITTERERLVFQRNIIPSVWIEGGNVEVRVFVHVSWDTKAACVFTSGDTLASLESSMVIISEVWSTETSEFPYGGLDKI